MNYRKEHFIGCATSICHSVVYSAQSVYTFGRNLGQLGYSLYDVEIQYWPRKIGSLPEAKILQATATVSDNKLKSRNSPQSFC